jgi:chaperonin GroES
MKLKPLGDRIVVKVLESEERTKSGIVIPDTAKEKPQKADVLAVGTGKFSEQTGQRIPMDVQVGDTVVFAKYGGTEIKLDGDEYLILSERDVLAILDK